jgi:hypothetical protein
MMRNAEKIMTKMLLSCKEATYLIEKRTVYPLSFIERCRLYIHVRLCVVCNVYQHQSKTIEKALAKWINSEGNSKDVLPPKTKEEIIEKIKEN